MSLTIPANPHATIFQMVKIPIVKSQPLKAVSCSLRSPSRSKTLVTNRTTPPRRLNMLDIISKPRTEKESRIVKSIYKIERKFRYFSYMRVLFIKQIMLVKLHLCKRVLWSLISHFFYSDISNNRTCTANRLFI